ncbi:hypothetical protein NGRA_2749 [Nosema granulosis]|uniref:Uncharacterized protein n=1 Tax=Nosema granulosis TaxID=83296 RepID=A0A9P6GWU5_9MICR|nr:hypothetical protein NGRA_2749 [Nosema granulosis]
MATATKAVREFNGDEGDGIEVWLKEVNIISQSAGLEPDALLGLIVVKLSGKTRSYLVSLRNGNLSSITLEEVLEGLKKRFENQTNTDEILERFLAVKTTFSYNEYTKLLKEATILLERECISLKSLIRLKISKSLSN